MTISGSMATTRSARRMTISGALRKRKRIPVSIVDSMFDQFYEHLMDGAVNAMTKSGKNSFHGDLFGFLRNGEMNARNAYALTNDGLKRNQFGGFPRSR